LYTTITSIVGNSHHPPPGNKPSSPNKDIFSTSNTKLSDSRKFRFFWSIPSSRGSTNPMARRVSVPFWNASVASSSLTSPFAGPLTASHRSVTPSLKNEPEHSSNTKPRFCCDFGFLREHAGHNFTTDLRLLKPGIPKLGRITESIPVLVRPCAPFGAKNKKNRKACAPSGSNPLWRSTSAVRNGPPPSSQSRGPPVQLQFPHAATEGRCAMK